ncbi:ATP adenylyltransferase C-terminal [Penicillium malachiteum]|uniref:ATP adenylyltransferase C-terminal n=1 Tax=Penicillium malachiteum TaxID=1324776 RepID=UPI002548BA4A|nr:ATP adenylyltransferase C-terminal [Penicillium malachiteum]KAJ5731441.1 ATP adenylyltransferase C-terminal [Penicillium malachiteum]
MQLGLSESLSALVARRFIAAKEGGDLVFSQTHLSLITAAGIPYQLRYCPALGKKPSNLKPETTLPRPKFDPFENPSPELLIAHFPPENPSHALVLNKFPVIPNHFILSTKEWRAQTDLLEKADLEAAYECLRTWGQDDNTTTGPAPRRLFAFFNSGEDSGASQPHRHLQFLPVEAMRQPETEGWHPLIDVLTAHAQSHPGSSTFQYLPHLPFAHFALPLPKNPSADTLQSIYISLYCAAVAATEGRDPRQGPTEPALSIDGPSAISYNLAMTLSTMMIAPRRSETAKIPMDPIAAGDIVDPGVLSLNGTILAGTLMVKAEAEWDALRSNPENLSRVLRDVGFSRVDSYGNSVL